MKIQMILTAICLILSINAYSDSDLQLAEAEADSSNRAASAAGFSYSLALDFISFDSGLAATRELSDSAAAFQLAGVYNFSRYFAASAGFGFFNLEDENQFSQLVVDDDGFVKVAESETDGTTLFAEVYLQNAPSTDGGIVYRLGLGAASIVGASREISDCDDCDSVEFDMQGGAYGLASVGMAIGERSTFGLTARAYLDGDMERSVLVWWQSH